MDYLGWRWKYNNKYKTLKNQKYGFSKIKVISDILLCKVRYVYDCTCTCDNIYVIILIIILRWLQRGESRHRKVLGTECHITDLSKLLLVMLRHESG